MRYAPQKRKELFSAYIRELQLSNALPVPDDAEMEVLYNRCRRAESTEWIDVYDGKGSHVPIGFLVLVYAPGCPFDAEICIKEAYVDPEFRRQGYMSSLVSYMLQGINGVICLSTSHLRKDVEPFWTNLLGKIGYVLEEAKTSGTEDAESAAQCYRPRGERSAV